VEFVRSDTTVLPSPSAHLPVLVDEWCQNETHCRTCSEAWTVRGKPSHPADGKLANPALQRGGATIFPVAFNCIEHEDSFVGEFASRVFDLTIVNEDGRLVVVTDPGDSLIAWACWSWPEL